MANAADKRFLADVARELTRARRNNRNTTSVHEGYAILLEEVEEFWAEVMRKPSKRVPQAMYQELVQVAAMAARTAADCVMPAGGAK